mmetsp:Transcript_20341/g.67934  ORF Transcript_20341/g.67934 Transcript_20341/m.67934 type:complete len:142 (+) Transcript_20341:1609-2034(+)
MRVVSCIQLSESRMINSNLFLMWSVCEYHHHHHNCHHQHRHTSNKQSIIIINSNSISKLHHHHRNMEHYPCPNAMQPRSQGKGRPMATSKMLLPMELETAMSPCPCFATITLQPMLSVSVRQPTSFNFQPCYQVRYARSRR